MNKITYLKTQKMLPYYNEQIKGWHIYFNERNKLTARRPDGFEVGIGEVTWSNMKKIKEFLQRFN